MTRTPTSQPLALRIEPITALLDHTAHTVRRVGRLKFSWPAGAQIKIFDAQARRCSERNTT